MWAWSLKLRAESWIWPSEELTFSWKNGSFIYFRNVNQHEKNEGVLWNSPDSIKMFGVSGHREQLICRPHPFEQRCSCLCRSRVFQVSHSLCPSLGSLAGGWSLLLLCSHCYFPDRKWRTLCFCVFARRGKWETVFSHTLPSSPLCDLSGPSSHLYPRTLGYTDRLP